MPPRPNTKKPVIEDESDKQSTSRKRSSRTRISAACEACKKRKTRCTGEPAPCHLCEILGTECVIDLSQDMRRRAAIQQTIHDSKSYQESLNGLIDCVRDGGSEVIQALRDVFTRADVTREEVSEAIQYWSQIVRNRAAGLPASVSASLDGHVDVDGLSQTTFQTGAKTDGHSSDWFLDPLLSEASLNEKDSNPSRIVGRVLGRLRTCSAIEGEQIIGCLIKANSIVEVENSLGVDDVNQLMLQQTYADDSDSTSEAATAEAARMYWHPALQVDGVHSAASSPIGNKGKSASKPPRQNFSAVELGYADLYHNVVQDHDVRPSLHSSEYQTMSDYLTEQPSKRSQTDQAPGLSMRLGQVLYQESQKTVFRMGKAAVSPLLVANDRSGGQMRLSIHLVQPLLMPDDSPMSRIYTDYLHGAKQTIAAKASVSDILGPDDDIVVDLLFRSRQQDDPWNCCSWACEACREFGESNTYVKLGCVFLMTRLMQWLILPTVESYAKLPDMIKPTPTQRMVPHIGAIDLIPFPCVRDASIEHLRDWLTPLLEARCSVNWPYFQDDAVEFNPNTPSRRLTKQFVDHVSNYQNWSVGAQFLKSFPEVAGRIRIHGE